MNALHCLARRLAGPGLLILCGATLAWSTPAWAQTDVYHSVVMSPPPVATNIAERPVQQQCCVVNEVNGQPEKDPAGPIDIIFDDGALWFTENAGYINRSADPNTTDGAATLEDEAIGRLGLNGRYTRILVPTRHSGPHFLVSGSAHKIYFTEVRGDSRRVAALAIVPP